MADPTINSQTLSTGGDHSQFGQPRARLSVSSLPSVKGAFVQRYGLGPQTITGRGTITAASRVLLKAAIRTTQNAANHAPTTYTDGDGSEHANCVLLDYRAAGDINRESATSFWVPVVWTILKQVS